MSEIAALSQALGQRLMELGWTITTAESCTGGGISAAITEIAGSSNYFNCAFITYSNESKSEMVNVSAQSLVQHGAVSRQVVEQMATGAAKKAKANIAIAVSGVAGPGGGSAEKPVGTVWIAIYSNNGGSADRTTVWSHCYLFTGDRNSIRQRTIETALTKVLALIGEKK